MTRRDRESGCQCRPSPTSDDAPRAGRGIKTGSMACFRPFPFSSPSSFFSSFATLSANTRPISLERRLAHHTRAQHHCRGEFVFAPHSLSSLPLHLPSLISGLPRDGPLTSQSRVINVLQKRTIECGAPLQHSLKRRNKLDPHTFRPPLAQPAADRILPQAFRPLRVPRNFYAP